jgi:hypothetical protein
MLRVLRSGGRRTGSCSRVRENLSPATGRENCIYLKPPSKYTQALYLVSTQVDSVVTKQRTGFKT